MSDPLSPGREAIANRIFGWGLALEEIAPGSRLGFDLALATKPGRRDLATVAGPDNFAQDLKVALLTPTGSDLFNIRFGFDGLRALTLPLEPSLVKDFLRLAVVKTVGGDARIKQVVSVTLELTEPEERRWTLHVEAQTVLGDVVALVLGEVDAYG